MFKKIALVTALLSLATIQTANAAEITVSSFTSAATVVNMAGAGTPSTTSFNYSGLTFSQNSTGSGGPGWRNNANANFGFDDNAGISDFTISLNDDYTNVGLNVYIGPATYLISFFNDSVLVGSISKALAANNSTSFAGWSSASGIDTIRITETSGDNGLIGGFNNIRFEGAVAAVPEPASVALIGLGLLGLGAARRKKQKAA